MYGKKKKTVLSETREKQIRGDFNLIHITSSTGLDPCFISLQSFKCFRLAVLIISNYIQKYFTIGFRKIRCLSKNCQCYSHPFVNVSYLVLDFMDDLEF